MTAWILIWAVRTEAWKSRALVSGFVAALTDGLHDSVEGDEDYGVVLREDGMPSPVVSGGCEDVANLALRLAVSRMIADRAGQPLSLLILDEPFGSLDDARRQNVGDLLRRLGSVFPQVLVISHVPDVRDCADATIVVELDPATGTSTARIETGVAA